MNVRIVAFTIAIAMMIGVSAFAAPAQRNGTTQAIQIIDGPRVEGTGDTWAVVAWTTNAGGSSIVHYGSNRNSLPQVAESAYSGAKVHSGKVTHRVRIKNLQPNTTYYFQVDSGQGSGTGTESKSGILNFQTKGQGQSSAMPANMSGDGDENMQHAAVNIIDGPRVEGTTGNSVVIAWTTNEASSSIVRYGTNPNSLSQTAQAPYADTEGASQQTHRVEINNLQPNTTYYFLVDSGQGEGTGTQAQSNIMRFQTGAPGSNSPGAYSSADNSAYQQYPPAPGAYGNQQYPPAPGAYGNQQYPGQDQDPYRHRRHEGGNQGYPSGQGAYGAGYGAVQIVDGPRVESVSNNAAVISWTTNGGGDSVIHWGNNPNSLNQVAQGSNSAANGQYGQVLHRVTINNLQPHTTYYFVADSGQNGAAGPQSHSSIIPFTTR